VEKTQDPEGMYCSILQTQPIHPDSEHNLGVLAVSLNKSRLALPLFKKALETNPSHGQFWSSYVDTLMKANQFDSFKYAIVQERKDGLTGEKVDFLNTQLTLFKLDHNSISPSKK
jgi:Tfp pilus assembly protein PilF